MVCNTEEQVDSIIAVGQEAGIGALQRFAGLQATTDEYGASTGCARQRPDDIERRRHPRTQQIVWWQTEHVIVATLEIAYKEDRTLWGIQTIGAVETFPQADYRQARILEPSWNPFRSLTGL